LRPYKAYRAMNAMTNKKAFSWSIAEHL
jgi:hypothetical protein